MSNSCAIHGTMFRPSWACVGNVYTVKVQYTPAWTRTRALIQSWMKRTWRPKETNSLGKEQCRQENSRRSTVRPEEKMRTAPRPPVLSTARWMKTQRWKRAVRPEEETRRAVQPNLRTAQRTARGICSERMQDVSRYENTHAPKLTLFAAIFGTIERNKLTFVNSPGLSQSRDAFFHETAGFSCGRLEPTTGLQGP